jgi:hypothetical protein
MESHWSVAVWFFLSSDAESFDFQKVTDILEFQPSKTRKKSECFYPPLATSYWHYQMPHRNTHSTETEMEKMQKLIEPHIDELKDFCKEQGIRSRFVVNVHSADESLPGIEATTEFVRFAASIGADICFDVACNLREQFEIQQ